MRAPASVAVMPHQDHASSAPAPAAAAAQHSRQPRVHDADILGAVDGALGGAAALDAALQHVPGLAGRRVGGWEGREGRACEGTHRFRRHACASWHRTPRARRALAPTRLPQLPQPPAHPQKKTCTHLAVSVGGVAWSGFADLAAGPALDPEPLEEHRGLHIIWAGALRRGG